jgi:hypothetical protein
MELGLGALDVTSTGRSYQFLRSGATGTGRCRVSLRLLSMHANVVGIWGHCGLSFIVVRFLSKGKGFE